MASNFDPSRAKRSSAASWYVCSLFIVTWAIASVAAHSATFADEKTVEFDRDIRPILSDKCFHCHGPDAERREADLRLDTREGATSSVVAPGDPEASELIARITSDDESLRMPPVESNLVLTDAEKELLRSWIAAGAEYSEHWAFQNLPSKVDVPRCKNDAWARDEIDQFVLDRLETEELSPTPRAGALRLLRRLSLDLTGLPPTVDEIEAFEKAATGDLDSAIAAAADRLLASPAFGEHMAVSWLDAARYADSYGYQSDELNTQWPYRDWVVRAFNDNLPYDQFLTCQLAGDLLENPTTDQILATAFNRMHRMTSEGGSIAEEWLAENAADRVHTFGSAMLGLTLECARCHDHKYDPILARDYYSLSAFFNSIDENGMYDHPQKVPSPTVLLPTPDQQQRLDDSRREVLEAEKALADVRRSAESRFEAWKHQHADAGREDVAATGEVSPAREAQGSGIAGAPPTSSGDAIAQSTAAVRLSIAQDGPDLLGRFTFDGDLANIPNEAPGQKSVGNGNGLPSVAGHLGQAIRSDGDRGIVFPDLLKNDRWDPFTIDLWIRDNAADKDTVVVAHRTYGTDVGYNGYDLTLAGGILRSRFYRVWPGNAIGVRANEAINANEWQHVTVTYDGSSRAAGLRIYLNGRELATTIERDRMVKGASFVNDGTGHLTLGERMRDRGFKDGEYDDLSVFSRALTPLEVDQLHALQSGAQPSTVTEPSVEQLRETYLSAFDEQTRQAAEKLREARRRMVETEDAIHEVSVMEEYPEPRPTYILPRGAYDAPKTAENRVERDVFLEMLPAFPAGAPRNRLGLARWLTAPGHPLTARVFVNRLWSNFFGQGLVSTPDNFGRQGSAPSHPELLDWLARDFIEHGWDVKRLCRQIVSSATYQQDSRAAAELRERDPDNVLLARGPSRRLSAEQIRDLALAASELLVREQGGPPVSPYQPGKDLWQESNSMSPPYQQSVGQGLHRRSLYSIWKRTAPLPNMLVFDATSREVCTIKRGRTSTPLQALVLLNDVQFIEVARAMAESIVKRHAEPENQIVEASMRLIGRPPDDVEQSLLLDLYHEQHSTFVVQDDQISPASQDAEKLIAIGETPADASLSQVNVAALTVVCQAILNLDATIYER